MVDPDMVIFRLSRHYLNNLVMEISIRQIALFSAVFALISCSGGPSQVASSTPSDPPTELDANCKTLQANYVSNKGEIDKLTAAMTTDLQEDTEVHIQLTALGTSKGAESVTSPEEMLAILNAVKMEHEKALEYCDTITAGTYPSAQVSQGERVAMIKVRNQQNTALSRPSNNDGKQN